MLEKERREHLRVDFSDILSFASCTSLDADAAESQSKGEGTAVDVSKGGLCLLSKDSMKDTRVVKLSIPLPGLSVHIPALAMVVWEKPFEDAYKVGMKFIA
jgi:hypothetical protein